MPRRLPTVPDLEDRLTQELERAARPPASDPIRLFDEIARRRQRRTLTRKVQVAVLAVIVLSMTAGGFAVLRSAFRSSVPAAPVDPQGTMTFTYGSTGIEGIWAMAGNGSSLRPLVSFGPSEPQISNVAISPDGSRVAYLVLHAHRDSAARDDVVVANADGSDARVVATTSISIAGDWWPVVWSPDGTKVAYLAFSGDIRADVVGPLAIPLTDIGVAEADGSGSRVLDVPGGPVFSLAWAPDGESFYAVRAERADGPTDLYTVDGDGNVESADTSTGTLWRVTVSQADGTVAVVAGSRAPRLPVGLPSGGSVQLLDHETGSLTQVSDPDVAGAAWSPDGTRIGVATILAPDGCQIRTFSSDGSGVEVLLHHTDPDPCAQDLDWGSGIASTFDMTPAPSPSPSDDAGSASGTDIGLGTNVCQAERLGGLNLVSDGVPDVAWTGYLVNEPGRCPPPDAQRWIVAVDVTDDGAADAFTDAKLVNCPYVSCTPLGGTDLDADGDEELVVTTLFSIRDQGYFSVRQTTGHTYAIDPIAVAPPGHPAAGIEAGKPLETSAGGDEGYAAWIRCEGYPSSPILVFASASTTVESNQPVEWHEVKLQLHRDDGMFHVVDATDLSLPQGQDPGFERSRATACGLDFAF
jgi:Tol biopolymer transport system component